MLCRKTILLSRTYARNNSGVVTILEQMDCNELVAEATRFVASIPSTPYCSNNALAEEIINIASEFDERVRRAAIVGCNSSLKELRAYHERIYCISPRNVYTLTEIGKIFQLVDKLEHRTIDMLIKYEIKKKQDSKTDTEQNEKSIKEV